MYTAMAGLFCVFHA